MKHKITQHTLKFLNDIMEKSEDGNYENMLLEK